MSGGPLAGRGAYAACVIGCLPSGRHLQDFASHRCCARLLPAA